MGFNLTSKVNFLCQKSSESFSFFFSLKIINLGAHFLLLTFLTAPHYTNSQNSIISFWYIDF